MTTPVPTPEHLSAVCRPGQRGLTCRYLVMRPTDPEQSWQCAKADPSVAQHITLRIIEGTMKAVGDHCTGPDEFRPYGE